MQANGLSPSRNKEVLAFILVGGGQVFEKYWLSAQDKGLVKITAIISKQPRLIFNKQFSSLANIYYQTNGTITDIVSILKKITRSKLITNPNIAILTPADSRYELTKNILSDNALSHSKIFLEKPYTRIEKEIKLYQELVATHSHRLHFAEKYAFSRANIFYRHLPKITPINIVGRLIEGGKYFQYLKKRLEKDRKHPYLIDGPELDLGFHLLDIIISFFFQIKNYKETIIEDVSCLKHNSPQGYAFTSKLLLKTADQQSVPIDIQSGKINSRSQRFLQFNYQHGSYIQYFTTGCANDPVYFINAKQKQLLETHDQRYHYYSRELQPKYFCRQTKEQQFLKLEITNLCLRMKKIRLESSNDL